MGVHLDILQSMPADTVLEQAVRAMRVAARNGFVGAAQPNSDREMHPVQIGPDNNAVAALIRSAMQEVDPRSDSAYDEETGILYASFSAGFEKPPINTILHNIKKRAQQIESCFTCNEDGSYLIASDDTIGFSVIEFLSTFVLPSQEMKMWFSLPTGMPFTDSSGKTHRDIVPLKVMDEFLKSEEGKALPDAVHKEVIRARYAEMEAPMAKRVFYELGLSIEPGRLPS